MTSPDENQQDKARHQKASQLSKRQTLFLPDLLDTTQEQTITEQIIAKTPPASTFTRFKTHFIACDGWFHVGLFMMQLGLFFGYWAYYKMSPLYRTMRMILGESFPVARGAAGALNVTSALMLLTTCRKSWTHVRKVRWIRRWIPLDRHVRVHRSLAMYVVVFAIVHTVAHCFNLSRFARFDRSTSFAALMLKGATGLTGVLLCAVLMVMSLTSMMKRLFRFEVFYYTHWLFLAYYALLGMHGAFCFVKMDAEEKCAGAYSWRYFLAPLALFLVEKLAREVGARRFPAQVQKIIRHPGGALELRFIHPKWIRNNCWLYRAGQFLYINVPEISRMQWHPFTITSSPEQDYVSIHVKVTGDFTKALQEHALYSAEASVKARREFGFEFEPKRFLPTFYLDGPYSSPFQDMLKDYKIALGVGCGIGITPFASLLRAIKYRKALSHVPMKLEKFYLIWVVRDVQSFEWFVELIKEIERDETLNGIVDFGLYWTVKRVTPSQCANIYMVDMQNDGDALTGLDSPTYIGRPRWDMVFSKLSQEHYGERVGTFFCGPDAMRGTLQNLCCENTTKSTKLQFHAESF